MEGRVWREGSATARLGVRDFEIHVDFGFQIGFLDFWISKWISEFQSGFQDFKVDFRISKRISGFQSGFLHLKVDSGFCLKKYCYFEDTAHEQ